MLEPLPDHAPPNPRGKTLYKLMLGALGVVYGDIGTSPLYAMKESFHPSHGLALNPANILGVLSLVFWSLTLMIAVKYLMFILRADNRGEGGIMALLALVIPKLKEKGDTTIKIGVVFLGLFGAALLYGDGVITPAISVLSAVEGLQIATPAFKPYVVPITIGLLITIFSQQKGGTSKLGPIFGTITLTWFITLIAIGLPWIIRNPSILAAVNPMYAVQFFMANGWHGYLVLGAVVLCITGGEALYADMGHFGKKPIRNSWYSLVFPALLINYFGQGALVLEKGGEVIGNTFYGLVSDWMIYPLVVLATAATIIASQALISGAFSLTQQAIHLGYFPRIRVLHTSRETKGQIYVPNVNLLLMLSCVTLVLSFRESSRLASAYGIAVTGTMAITSILFYLVTRMVWGWSKLGAGLLLAFFLVIDFAFFGANIIKIADGGWVPILIAAAIFTVMVTWKKGRQILSDAMEKSSVPLDAFISQVENERIHRYPGTAIFMTLAVDVAPTALVHHVRHNRGLREKVVLLSVVSRNEPEIPRHERVQITPRPSGFWKVVASYGYMESPDIAEILAACEREGLKIHPRSVGFYLGRETIVLGGDIPIAEWRKRLFIFFQRNSRPASEYFRMPPDKVIEIGAQIRI